MAAIRRCNRCGNLLPSDAPEGTCPACTPGSELEPDSEPTGIWAGKDVTLGFELAQPGHVLEGLTKSIGTVPRVLLPDTSPDETAADVAWPQLAERPAPTERGDRYQLFGEIAR